MTNPSRIISLASAFYDSQVLFTASDLNIFGILSELGSADVAAVAESAALNPRGARLLLDACVSLDLLSKHGDMYANTPESALFLVPGSPGDLSQAIRYNRDVYEAWGKLPDLIKTGQPVERPETHLGEDSDRTRTFVLSMHGRALGMGRLLIPQLDLEDCRQILDVGGGPGTYSVLIAQRYPELSSTIIDLPGVAAVADELIVQQGMSDRVKTLPGSYHDTAFPEGNDAVLFLGVLHQESPEDITALFKKAYASLKPGGKVYVMDMMTDETHTKPAFSALFAVNMALTTTNGWVFSDAELKGWLTEAGFSGFSVAPLPPPMPHWLATVVKER
ncbi:MAG: methyltransferase [Lentisphaeria bacterium]|nr:methyltransferase [Lentisphaeria bacterium]